MIKEGPRCGKRLFDERRRRRVLTCSLPGRARSRLDEPLPDNDETAWRGHASFLDSLISQVLMLKDAIETGDRMAVLKAFALVSRVCGLDWLATHAGVDRERLLRALDGPSGVDFGILNEVVERLLLECRGAADASAGARFQE